VCCQPMGMLSVNKLQRNFYQQLYKCNSACNNVSINAVLGILWTRLDNIGKAMSPL
jgi:hypothetical protein